MNPVNRNKVATILEHLRLAEHHLMIASGKAGEYRGWVGDDLVVRDIHRRGIKTMLRVRAMAVRIEALLVRRGRYGVGVSSPSGEDTP